MKVISRYPLWSWFTYRNQSHNVDAHNWNLKEYAFLIRMAIFIQYLFAVHFAFAKLLWGVWLGRWRELNRRACNKIYLRVGNDDRAKYVYIFINVNIYICALSWIILLLWLSLYHSFYSTEKRNAVIAWNSDTKGIVITAAQFLISR